MLGLHNGGNVTATGTITLELFLSPDAVAGNGDDMLVSTLVKHISIKAGATSRVLFHANLANMTVGTYHLVSIIDSTNVLTESNKANNTVLGGTVTLV